LKFFIYIDLQALQIKNSIGKLQDLNPTIFKKEERKFHFYGKSNKKQ